jgi:hypothetical protein
MNAGAAFQSVELTIEVMQLEWCGMAPFCGRQQAAFNFLEVRRSLLALIIPIKWSAHF